MSRRVALTEIPVNRPASVVEILGGHGVHGRLLALGIRPGVTISKVTDSFARGPLVVKVGNSQTALGRGVCSKILVEVPD